MLADVDICSMALSHIGISNTIQSINPPDQSVQAQACAFWYPKCRDQLMQSAPWNFAYTYIALASDSSAVSGQNEAFPGWPFAYQYPSDCLQAIAVTTAAGQRYSGAFWTSWWWPSPMQNIPLPKIPFKVIESQGSPGQLAITCDVSSSAQSPLFLFYIQQVTNTALFDPMFCDALSYLLASRIGGVLRADVQRVQMATQMADRKRLEALAQHLNASQQDLERDSPSVLIR